MQVGVEPSIHLWWPFWPSLKRPIQDVTCAVDVRKSQKGEGILRGKIPLKLKGQSLECLRVVRGLRYRGALRWAGRQRQPCTALYILMQTPDLLCACCMASDKLPTLWSPHPYKGKNGVSTFYQILKMGRIDCVRYVFLERSTGQILAVNIF